MKPQQPLVTSQKVLIPADWSFLTGLNDKDGVAAASTSSYFSGEVFLFLVQETMPVPPFWFCMDCWRIWDDKTYP